MVSTKPNQTECQYCSVISQTNREDPIGTARTHDHWLILELKQPWSPAMWVEDEELQPLVKNLKQLIWKKRDYGSTYCDCSRSGIFSTWLRSTFLLLSSR
ncbi:hypothetical protein CWATWH0402_1150 [Crocosphaera watsonii WH 0402]|uniref:Uncharacterized protein n=1 Tax=Crocosphaera watsonii WH 0402 TaxID=1284629 RepID=T2JXP5_CROWT|nr:hypothetical protein [Crocosphaera watsonii]CCQ69985.1 hypothetical protein CWATWH0402_1150 [Crocosphaera watsonii WH 0402]